MARVTTLAPLSELCKDTSGSFTLSFLYPRREERQGARRYAVDRAEGRSGPPRQ